MNLAEDSLELNYLRRGSPEKAEAACQKCGGALVRVESAGSVHHARLVCDACGTFVKWLPAARPEAQLRLPDVPLDMDLPMLTGVSKSQTQFGEAMRSRMLEKLLGGVSRDQYRALRSITDSSWWIANRDRAPELIRWPEAWYGSSQPSQASDDDDGDFGPVPQAARKLPAPAGPPAPASMRPALASPLEKITHITDLSRCRRHWKHGTVVKLNGVDHVIHEIALAMLSDNTLRIVFFDDQGKAFYVGRQIIAALSQ